MIEQVDTPDFLTEGFILATLGCVAGLFIAQWVFTALRRIPRISLRGHAVDVAGRTGLGLVFTGLGGEVELVFDATTYRYLGLNRQLGSRFVELGRGGSVVVREAVRRVAVVDRVGDLG